MFELEFTDFTMHTLQKCSKKTSDCFGDDHLLWFVCGLFLFTWFCFLSSEEEEEEGAEENEEESEEFEDMLNSMRDVLVRTGEM